MTLRSRLVLVLVGVVLAGLVITDFVTYAELRSYLLSRTDPSLDVAAFPVIRALEAENGLTPALPVPGSTAAVPSASPALRINRSGTQVADPREPTVTSPPASRSPTRGGGRVRLIPAGTVGELVGPGSKPSGTPVLFSYGGSSPPLPVLPRTFPAPYPNGDAVFSAASRGGVTYRVLARPLRERGLTAVVAIPLTDVTDTLGRLLLLEALVSGAVLLGLSVLGWWVVRRGLRPLEGMARTAGVVASGNLGQRVAPADDRSEVGRLGRALNTMLGRIEDAFAARAESEGRLRRFLADASHELRTPLTSIRGYAEIFDLGARAHPEDLATSMRHIREEASRMELLVNDLLLLAQLDQERPLELDRVDVAQLAHQAARAAQVGAPGSIVQVEAPTEALVWGDRLRLRQVLDNLVANALRHGPPGAPVDLRVTANPARAGLPTPLDDGRPASNEASEGGPGTSPPTTLIEICDRGPGVRPEDAPRIFEPFYRADASRARRTGGAGLGLAIASAIVRAHGGTIGVRPAPAHGEGACFWVEIPAAPDPGLAPRLAPLATDGDPPGPSGDAPLEAAHPTASPQDCQRSETAPGVSLSP